VTKSVRRTQRQRSEESSRRLAQAAVELIAEKGYSNTTAREIGERAGFSRSMVGERFGTKDALFDAILEEQYERRVGVDGGPGSSGLESLLAPFTAMRDFAHDDPQLLRALLILNFDAVHDSDFLRRRVQDWLTRMRATLSDAIRRGQVDGSVTTTVDADDLGAEMMATGIGYSYAWIVTPEHIDFPATLMRWRDSLLVRLQPR
jgi:AcrR family transcriptional regulator